MREPVAARLAEAVRTRAGQYYRLVLLVGPPESGKTRALAGLSAAHGWPCLNVNLLLSERLIELTRQQRAVHAARLLGELVEDAGREVVLLDNLELLFSQDLAQDPLRLLQGLSRNRTIVAVWPGTYDGTRLTYATPGHIEFRSYSRPEVGLVPIEPAARERIPEPGTSADEGL